MSVLRTKPISDVIAQSEADGEDGRPGLKRRLGARDLTGFGIGIVIGTGIFTLTGLEARDSAGPGVVISFAIAGVVALLAALCYAELASSVPAAGSAYTYAYATMGEIVAWIIGWDLLLEFALGAAVVARGWSGYLAELFDLPVAWFGEEGSVVNLGAIGIVLLLGVVAIIGVRESARVTNVLVLVKVAICVFIVIAGAFFVKAANLTPFVPPAEPAGGGEGGIKQPVTQALFGLEPSVFGFVGVLSAAAVVFFAYTGFEAVANLGEETRRPRRDLTLGLLGTLLISTVLYIGVSLVLVGMVPYDQIDRGAPIAAAFEAVGASWAGILVSIAAVAGLTSVILVDLVAMGRIGFAISRDGLIPPSVATIHPRWGTPYRISAVMTVVVALLAGFLPLSALADLVSIGALCAFVLVSVAVPILRRKRPELDRPFKVPFNPVLPIVSAVACLYLMLNLSVETWLRFGAWMLLGAIIYFGYGYRRNRLAEREHHAAG
ncbi:amino acid permease [Micromonospora endolithica]|uniref:Amino acid permease n=1 Tax=Micromonospora endolithica TaxID=230091 RepID=A0A3A9ZA79_9ACTN|nr:amino acid permease [Micromonospora endolithica]RKN44226.1 amino acid permease [Micromonospora endolithica]TWJ25689.1 amino acid/polyamine/organocation transporter, APC superfamily (TC 2.A.3) [Micromonospora endolithica]